MVAEKACLQQRVSIFDLVKQGLLAFHETVRLFLLLCLVLLGSERLCGSDGAEQLEPVIVTADRMPDSAQPTPFSQLIVTEAELRTAPQLLLDDVLRNAAPGFSLFRRSSSRVAHPTTQAVSLRNLGSNGAGRTLVLLDGIPANDPFGGWVPWSRVRPTSLKEVIVNPGGGAGLFGNAALAGTIHLLSADPATNTAHLEATAGNYDTFDTALGAHLAAGTVGLWTFFDRFSSGGYPVLRADQRGPIDTNADAETWVWEGRLDWRAGENTRFGLAASAFAEDRGDGTLYTHNSNAGQDVSATFQQRFTGLEAALRIQAYTQLRRFDSRFSGVNSTRTVETPALDQYGVPATALGGSVVWEQVGTHRVTGGADARWIEGETRERFFFNHGEFTRDRRAGGRQLFVGVFLEERWQATPAMEFVNPATKTG